MNLTPIMTGLSTTSPAELAQASSAKDAKAASGVPDDATKIAQSAQGFEAMLVRQVLENTLKPTSATGGSPAPGSEIYQGFITDIVAEHISKGGSLGFAHLLQSQLKPAPRPPNGLHPTAK